MPPESSGHAVESTAPNSKELERQAACENCKQQSRAELQQLDEASHQELWPHIPSHARDYLRINCPDILPLAMAEAEKLAPELLEDPELAPFELDECIKLAREKEKLAAVAKESSEIASLDQTEKRIDADSDAIDSQISTNNETITSIKAERREVNTSIIALRKRISGNLTGEDKLGQLDQLMTDVQAEKEFPEAEKKAALQQLAMIRSTLAAMGQVMTSETSQAAFQRIVATSSLNLGAGGLATTFAPVMAQVEASTEISASEKQRLREIVTGSDAQDALAETVIDENGVEKPRYTKDKPRDFRDGVSGYATENGRQILDLNPGDHPIEMDITGWRGEQVGQLIEVMTIAHDFESVGLTGYLKSTYHVDFALVGDAGLTPDEVTKMHNVIDFVLGGLETSDGDIIRSGERLGYLRHFARLHNPQGTATGFENDQSQTEFAARDLHYKNDDGSIDWEVLKSIGQFARTTYLSGDADYDDLKAYLQRQHPEKFDTDGADLSE